MCVSTSSPLLVNCMVAQTDAVCCTQPWRKDQSHGGPSCFPVLTAAPPLWNYLHLFSPFESVSFRFQLQEGRVFGSSVHSLALTCLAPLHCASSSGSALTSQPTFPLPETLLIQLQLWIILNGSSVARSALTPVLSWTPEKNGI